MEASEWDERYAERELIWSGKPNGSLVAEVADLPPGRALDVGCGEGADAVWLAQRGWQVTGLDVSEVALGRAQALAAAVGVQVAWVNASLSAYSPAAPGFDLVTVQYPALQLGAEDREVRGLASLVAAGRTLLVVGHAHVDPERAKANGFDPADYLQPADVAAGLGDGWVVDVDEERPRIDPPEGTEHLVDHVVRARRTA